MEQRSGKELSLEMKLRQKSVLERIQSNFAGESTGPWVVELDPTTACNLACHDCISGNLINRGGFERERLKEVAREFKELGVRAVVLIGGGEPTAHPEFGSIVEYFYENDIHVGVTTNGVLIDRYLDVLAEKTKWVRVSVDAGSDEMFKEFRPSPSGKSYWKKVIEGMRALGQRKKCRMGYSFLVLSKRDEEGRVTKSNVSDIVAAAHVAKEIGCDYFEVKPSFDMMHFLNEHSSEVQGVVAEQLEQIRGLEDERFKIISPYTLGQVLEGAATQPKEYRRCLISRFRTLVTPSGVYVCPYFRGNPYMRLGDATIQPMNLVWNGEKGKSLLRRVNPSIHCPFHCIRHASNQLLEKWAAEGIPENALEEFDRFI